MKKYLKFEGTEKLQAKMIMKGMEEFDQKTKKRWRDGMLGKKQGRATPLCVATLMQKHSKCVRE